MTKSKETAVVSSTLEGLENALKALKYLPGNPKQYRADAKMGNFNINGKTVIGTELTLHPVAWRIFEDDLFGRGRKKWVEIFFIDKTYCLSSIMMNGFSVEDFLRFNSELFYESVTLDEIVIHISWEKRTTTTGDNQKIVYYIASFEKAGEVAPGVTERLKTFADEVRIYRQDTLQDTCFMLGFKNYFFNAEELHNHKPTGLLEEGSKEAWPENPAVLEVETVEKRSRKTRKADKVDKDTGEVFS